VEDAASAVVAASAVAAQGSAAEDGSGTDAEAVASTERKSKDLKLRIILSVIFHKLKNNL